MRFCAMQFSDYFGDPPPPQFNFDSRSHETPGTPVGAPADALRAGPSPVGRRAPSEVAGVNVRSSTCATSDLMSQGLGPQQAEHCGATSASVDVLEHLR